MEEKEFLEKHSGLVYNLALRLTGNAADAEDLAQDSLIRALKALKNFRGDSSPATWAYRITVNTWKNRVRSEKRRAFWKTVSLGLYSGGEEDEGPQLAADEPPLDKDLETGETGSLVQKALLTLDEESRAVIVLREIEGQSYDEIAAALDVPVGTVKSRLFRARETLKEKLAKQFQP